MIKYLVFVCALASCIRSNEVTCGDGRVCPPNNSCDDVNHLCISPSQAAACQGLAAGSACTFEGVAGTCDANGACQPLVCGDGIRTGTEACDGSDLGSATCLTAGYYDPDGLACTPFCTFDTSSCVGRCGDGIINGPELCDGSPPDGTCITEGLDAGPLACSASCGASLSGCARFGWVAESIPLSMPSSISGTSDDDLWVVGDGGVALHFNGAAWTPIPTGLSDDILRVSAVGSNDVWAVDSAVVIHWDGTQWSNANAPAGAYVDLCSGSDVVAAATATSVVAWDGSIWQVLGDYVGGAISVIRGIGATDIWVADPTTLWHWNGASWTASLTANVESIAAIAPADVWVAGSVGAPTFDSMIAHWNGTSWSQTVADEAGLYGSIAADAPNDLWISSSDQSIYHFDGSAVTDTLPLSLTGRGALLDVHDFGPGDIVGVSGDGLVYRYHGQSYVEWRPGDAAVPTFAWMDAGNDIFVIDVSGHIAHWDGANWTGETTVVDTNTFTSLFGTGSDNVWAATDAGVMYRYTTASNTWTKQTSPFSATTKLWGTGPDDMWAFSGAVVAHYDGSTWTTSALTPITNVTGSSSTDIWAFGGVTLVHFDGSTWSTVMSPSTSALIGIASTAPDRVVAVDSTYAYLWDGTSWTQMLVPVVNGIQHVVASAPNQVVVSTPNELAQFDGTEWAPMRIPADQFANIDASISALMITPNMYAMLVGLTTQPFVVRALLRTQPWVCEAHEVECGNGVDDDCDGLIDQLDPDCQH